MVNLEQQVACATLQNFVEYFQGEDYLNVAKDNTVTFWDIVNFISRLHSLNEM